MAVVAGVSITAANNARGSQKDETAPVSSFDGGDSKIEATMSCPAESEALAETLTADTSWALCWRMDYRQGLVLENVGFKTQRDEAPISVLKEIGLSQLNVAYDDGSVEYNDITSYGFGGGSLEPMTSQSCTRGMILDVDVPVAGTLGAVCVAVRSYGPSYGLHDGETFEAAGTELVLTMQSKVNWYEYYTEYRFRDDGQIDVQLGATGDLSPSGFTDDDSFGSPIGPGETNRAISHFHSAIWRVLFAVGGDRSQTVERSMSTADTATIRTTTQPVDRESSFTVQDLERFRIVNYSSLNADEHPRSYDLALTQLETDTASPHADYDLAFSNADATELFASDNLSSVPGATKDAVPDFVSDAAPLTEPVAWVNVGFHHHPRDEDQSPMPVHWQGFSLTPRDFTAQSPLTPASRTDINGRTGSPLEAFLPANVTLYEGGGYMSPPFDPRMPATASGDVAPYAKVIVPDFKRIEGESTGDVPGNVADGDPNTVWDGASIPPATNIRLLWPQAVRVGQVTVHWKQRGENGVIPLNYTLEYLDTSGSWNNLPFQETQRSDDNNGGTTTSASFDPLTTSGLRLTGTVEPSQSVAIEALEVEDVG